VEKRSVRCWSRDSLPLEQRVAARACSGTRAEADSKSAASDARGPASSAQRKILKTLDHRKLLQQSQHMHTRCYPLGAFRMHSWCNKHKQNMLKAPDKAHADKMTVPPFPDTALAESDGPMSSLCNSL